jgi:hypothetical protein
MINPVRTLCIAAALACAIHDNDGPVVNYFYYIYLYIRLIIHTVIRCHITVLYGAVPKAIESPINCTAACK